MRVLQLCQKPQRRGAEVFAVGLAGALGRCGHPTTVAFLHRGPDPQMAPDAPVLGGREGGVLARLLPVEPALLRALRRLVRELRPEVIQLNGASSVKYGAFCLPRGRHTPGSSAPEPRNPVLIYRNIGRPQDWVRGAARRLFYRRLVMPRMDGVAAVSRSTLAEVEGFYRLAAPSAVIPTAVDPASLRPRRDRLRVRAETDTPPDAPVVIQVGSLSREKRPDRLLAVFAALRERVPDAQLWLLGDGPLRTALETRCVGELARSVHFLGSREDVGSFLAAADVLALASDTEGMPAALLEAGCLGLPVVATRVGGVAECVTDGETGLLVEPGDDAALGRALGDLLASPERRRSLGEAGRRRVLREHTFDAVAGRFVELYERARQSPGDPP